MNFARHHNNKMVSLLAQLKCRETILDTMLSGEQDRGQKLLLQARFGELRLIIEQYVEPLLPQS